MSVIARKLRTLQRVARAGGARGIASALSDRATRSCDEARHAREVLAARVRHGRPRMLLSYRGGIGDDVLCTILLRELRRRGFGPVWMLSKYPDLYELNDDVPVVLDWGKPHERWLERLGLQVLNARYFTYDEADDRAVRLAPEQHMVATMCQLVGIVGPIVRRPYLFLRDEELAAGALVPDQIAIQSSGLVSITPMQNKQWFTERFQEVVTALRSEFNFVQLGSPTDPPLEGALDMRGRTTRRQTAAIIRRSLTYVGNIGFGMHVARAVERRAVVIYGGRERPDQSGYSCNENLYTDVPCAPCWRRNACDFDRRCMRQITAADVVAAVRRAVAGYDTPLEVDTDDVPAGPLLPPGRDGRPRLSVTTPRGITRIIEAKVLAGSAG